MDSAGARQGSSRARADRDRRAGARLRGLAQATSGRGGAARDVRRKGRERRVRRVSRAGGVQDPQGVRRRVHGR